MTRDYSAPPHLQFSPKVKMKIPNQKEYCQSEVPDSVLVAEKELRKIKNGRALLFDLSGYGMRDYGSKEKWALVITSALVHKVDLHNRKTHKLVSQYLNANKRVKTAHCHKSRKLCLNTLDITVRQAKVRNTVSREQV